MGDAWPIGLDLFDAGDKLICCTRPVYNRAVENEKFRKLVQTAIFSFFSGDWGDVCEEDGAMNDADPDFAMGAYGKGDDRIWIKADGNYITILFPSEW